MEDAPSEATKKKVETLMKESGCPTEATEPKAINWYLWVPIYIVGFVYLIYRWSIQVANGEWFWVAIIAVPIGVLALHACYLWFQIYWMNEE